MNSKKSQTLLFELAIPKKHTTCTYPFPSLILDACGCCPICARGANERCGGPFGTSGSCAAGLNCLKKCGGKNYLIDILVFCTLFNSNWILCKILFLDDCEVEVKSNGGRESEFKKCVFPFAFKGKTYFGCTKGSQNSTV